MNLRANLRTFSLMLAVASILGMSPSVVAQSGAGLAAAKPVAKSPANSGNVDALLYRQKIMLAMNEQSAVLGQIVSGAVTGDNLALHLESMALLASTGLKAYEKQALGGEARPEIWRNWPDFSRKMQDFATETKAAAALIETEGEEAALRHMMDSMSCRACHRAYRDEKK